MKSRKRMTQNQKIYLALKPGKWVHYAKLNRICFRYGARIFDLRRMGVDIGKKKVGDEWYYRCFNPRQENNIIPQEVSQ